MTDEFLTEGLRNDRYLKAIRLVEQFETEMEARLLDLGQRMVDEHPDLFGSSVDPHVRTRQNSNSSLAHQRIHYKLDGIQVPEGEKSQYLNVHLYWMAPTEYARTDIDGALRALGYKIKRGALSVDDWVVEQTKKNDWPIETSENPFDDNIVFYNHVSSVDDIEATSDTLVEHFAEFGDAYLTN